jgi:hypothetical protein
MSGNSDYVISSNQHASRGLKRSVFVALRRDKREAAVILKLLSQCCNAAGLGTRHSNVFCHFAIKKEKAVTLNQLLPYVYDSCLLSYGRPGTLSSQRYPFSFFVI